MISEYNFIKGSELLEGVVAALFLWIGTGRSKGLCLCL